MAGVPTREPTARNRTICLPIDEARYEHVVQDAGAFRAWVTEQHVLHPELFPEQLARGFCLKDSRTSARLGIVIRRIQLPDGTAWSIRPSFVMPGMTARTEDVRNPLFLRKFAVPYWALAEVFGRNAMYYHRLQSSLGRNSLAGTTVRKGPLPQDLLGDEHHQTCDGRKVYIASTVGDGCWLGAEIAESAGTDDLTAAYRVFANEALNIKPDYQPATVNTDGWGPTQAAWQRLFPLITILECFLHAWLSIRTRGKKHELFEEVSRQVWDAWRAVSVRSFSQRIRRLRSWADSHLTGWIHEKTIRLCEKRSRWAVAYQHPTGHRTSNMLDRMMRGMNRYYSSTQHFHGSLTASRLTSRSQALLWNFTPWHPSITRRDGWQSPAERLNKHRYHDDWLQNLLISASCGGYRYRQPPQTP